MTMQQDNCSAIPGFIAPPCVVCESEMNVKEVRRHNDPAFDVCFLKCPHCGLERPMVVDRTVQ